MLFLLIHLGGERYALDAGRVVEVLPLVEVKAAPHAPAGVAGAINYRGAFAPVLDLHQLILGQPARARLSTRIILVGCGLGGEAPALLGLIAEHATGTFRADAEDFVSAGVVNTAPYLGPIALDARGSVQRLELDGLLSPALSDALFRRRA